MDLLDDVVVSCYDPQNVMVGRKRDDGRPRIYQPMTVNCGRCLGCRTKQARDWSFRLIHESYTKSSAFYLTLTYAPEYLPENGSLEPEEFRKWLKRLRKRSRGRISYYGCGEYGDITGRPHYHAIVLGSDLFLDRLELGRRDGYKLYQSDTLDKTWPQGFVELQGMSYGAAAYVAGYVRKKVSKSVDPDAYERVKADSGELVEIEPEFSSVSRRPAIGREWIRRMWREVYPRDHLRMNGFEFRPPRYYDKWMDEDHTLKAKEPQCPMGCDEHREMMVGVREKRLEEAYSYTAQELEAKEKHHRKKVLLFQERGAI